MEVGCTPDPSESAECVSTPVRGRDDAIADKSQGPRGPIGMGTSHCHSAEVPIDMETRVTLPTISHAELEAYKKDVIHYEKIRAWRNDLKYGVTTNDYTTPQEDALA